MSVQPEPSISQPIPFGRYHLVRRIGAGGMGEVFLARDAQSDRARACVIKKVLPHLSENKAFVGRFRDESRVVVRLKHPNVARVYAMGEVNNEYFLAMEYVQGKTVSRFTRRLRERKQVMPLGLILLIGEKVCAGLAYAHDAKDEQGGMLHLVHRDLSPANVCISYRGEVKIIDFGAAQSTLKEEQTAPRVVIGNLTYMAPEQARKQLVDRRADVYSAGVLLWELLAWFALPQKGDPIERWRRAANPVWDPPSFHRKNLPKEIDGSVLKALEKDPARRYADAAVFGAELKRLRLKHAPDVDERDLGQLLSLSFEKEKRTEDDALEEVLHGVPVGADLPTDKTRRGFVVPPTALAFEHSGLAAPEGFVPEDQEVTDPEGTGKTIRGGGTPTPSMRPRDQVNPTRVILGVTMREEDKDAEPSIVEEIDPINSGPHEHDGEYHTSPYDTSGTRRWILICVGVFAAASAVGFGIIWFALRSG